MLNKLCPFFTLIWSLSLESTSKRINTGSVSPGNIYKTKAYLVILDFKQQYVIMNIIMMSKGMISPALANSTSSFGRVAENSRVCLVSGSLRMISWSCSAKPISNNLHGGRTPERSHTHTQTNKWIHEVKIWHLSHLSASSNTTYSTLCNFRFISWMTCMRRPGVPMILGEKHREIRVTTYSMWIGRNDIIR